jgi:hypothetical protein
MSTLKEVSDNLKSVDQKLASVRSGQYDQNRLNIDNSDRLIAVMEDVVMRTGRSENILSQMFGHLGYIRRKLQKGVSVEKDSSVVERAPDPSFVGPIRPDPVATGDSLEERREQQQWQNDLLDAIRALSESKKDDKNESEPKKEGLRIGEMLRSVGLIGGLLAASLGAAFGSFMAYLTPVTKLLGGIANRLGPVQGLFISFVEGIKNLGTRIKEIGSSVGKTLKNAFTINPDGKLGKALQFMKDLFGGKGKGPIGKIIESITKTFKSVGGYLSKFSGIFKTFAGLAGRLFYPIAGIIVSVKSVFDSIKSGSGIFDTFKNLVDDLFTFFVTDLLDMVKGAIGWISGKLGFEGIQEYLSSFSFSDMYLVLSEKLFGVIESIGTYASDIFGDLIGGFKKLISGDFIEGIVGIFTAINKPFKDLREWLGDIIARVLETLAPKNLALLAAGSENAKGFDYILKGETILKGDAAAVKPMTGSELDKAVKENNKTSDNPIIIQDNSNNSTNTSGGGGGETHVHTGVTSTDGADPNILAFGR